MSTNDTDLPEANDSSKAANYRSGEVSRAVSGSANWDSLRAEILKRIAAIDDATPWSEREPQWWLHMMDVERAVRNSQTRPS